MPGRIHITLRKVWEIAVNQPECSDSMGWHNNRGNPCSGASYKAESATTDTNAQRS
ncbi:hypothetical protein MASSI9I_70317 [Massilia sp. 9I]|nr:hypothetical protein MASSI9I_70317 [Massilia sp. 9I]